MARPIRSLLAFLIAWLLALFAAEGIEIPYPTQAEIQLVG